MSKDADSSQVGAEVSFERAEVPKVKSYIVTFQRNSTFEIIVKGTMYKFPPHGSLQVSAEWVDSSEVQHYLRVGGFFSVQEVK